jgi:rfaE bifunctional protein kinase chain/domain
MMAKNTNITKERFEFLTKQFSTLKPILVLGDVGIDKYTYGEVNRISPEAPVPILEVTKEWHKLGLAANVSDNLLSLGVLSTLCGVIGNDRYGELLENLLEENHLKTWGIVRDTHRKTTLKERVTTKYQQICRIDYESSETISGEIHGNINRRIQEFLEQHSALIIEDYSKGLLTEELCQKSIKLFQDAGKMVLVDPNRLTPARFYKGADLLKPNLAEALALVESLGYEEKKLDVISDILMEKLNLKMLVITLGGDGIALRTQSSKLKIIPTAATEVFDVSGAGDTVISVLSLVLLSGGTLEEAAQLSNFAAGIVVGKKGTATVSIEELSTKFI